MDRAPLPTLPDRPDDGHKGSFGTVGIIAGSAGNAGGPGSLKARMIGAPALVALGANSAGCGLVKVATPEPILNSVLTLAPMATGYPIGVAADGSLIAEDASAVLDRLASESDALVIGPGIGSGHDIELLVRNALSVQSDRCKGMVLDADAINALCTMGRAGINLAHIPAILTPHHGEAKRMLDALGLEDHFDGTPEKHISVCNTLADALGCVVVLKGKGTVVSDGTRDWTCQHGHPCLATGGTGDVLAGVIGSLIAQYAPNSGLDLFACACIGAEAHAKSGEQWTSEMGAQAGLNPQNLVSFIPAQIHPNHN